MEAITASSLEEAREKIQRLGLRLTPTPGVFRRSCRGSVTCLSGHHRVVNDPGPASHSVMVILTRGRGGMRPGHLPPWRDAARRRRGY